MGLGQQHEHTSSGQAKGLAATGLNKLLATAAIYTVTFYKTGALYEMLLLVHHSDVLCN